MIRRPPRSPLFPYPPLFRSDHAFRSVPLEPAERAGLAGDAQRIAEPVDRDAELWQCLLEEPAAVLPLDQDRLVRDPAGQDANTDRKSTRLNSSHSQISYAVF